MWTPNGRTKSVHNSELSTLVKLGVATGHIADHSYFQFNPGPLTLGQKTTVHTGEVSTVHTSETWYTGLYRENQTNSGSVFLCSIPMRQPYINKDVHQFIPNILLTAHAGVCIVDKKILNWCMPFVDVGLWHGIEPKIRCAESTSQNMSLDMWFMKWEK